MTFSQNNLCSCGYTYNVKKFNLSLAILLLVPIMMLLGCGSLQVSGTPTHEQSEGDFRIYISIENTNIRAGQDFEVEITFKNLSGREINLIRSFDLVRIIVPKFYEDAPPAIGVNDTFEIDEVRVYTNAIGSRLARGVHEVYAIAGFGSNGENYIVFSNAIFINVR